jgi:sialate O-acetylesterase
VLVASARADVKLPSIFSDHMVLQQGMAVPVWGWADPGEQVTVSVGSEQTSTTAGADGKWLMRLNHLTADATPIQMTVAGKNTITIKDVLIGEVWLGSGQSNMEFSVSKKVKPFAGVIDEEKEIAAADYPQVRMFTVKMKLSELPQDDCEGSWQVCSPETVPAFSAVGYFFSRDLYQAIKQPVGFLNVSYGASTAQAWISKSALETDPQFQPMLDAFAKSLADWSPGTTRPAPVAASSEPTTRRASRAARAPKNPREDQHNPTLLWNAMLHPVQPYAIRGVVWYQGESITGSTAEYAALMRRLIESWRSEWGQGQEQGFVLFPFYFVQLAGQDANSNRPEVREAQADALAEPETAMAVTIDIGDKKNVHPKNKQDVGDRLARIARAKVYHEKIEYSGPMYDSMQIEGNTIRVKFTHIGAGLVAKGGDELKTFQVAGGDGKFVEATARIEGETVVVSSPDVTEPKAVRYAWNRWPEGCNLYNGDGLPAAPFRTDGPR